MALAPSFDLFSVPSSSLSWLSISNWSSALRPKTHSAISFRMFSTALLVPLPPNLLPPSLSSTASALPVEAPLGTDALPITPESKITSHSTVGLPLLSIISLAKMSVIVLMKNPFTLNSFYIILKMSIFFNYLIDLTKLLNQTFHLP